MQPERHPAWRADPAGLETAERLKRAPFFGLDDDGTGRKEKRPGTVEYEKSPYKRRPAQLRFGSCGTDSCKKSPASVLRPEIAVQSAVLDGFADVVGLDGFGTVEIGDGAGDFQDAVIGAGAEIQLGHRHFDEILSGLVELAVDFEMTGGHAGVAGHFAFSETFALNCARGLHPTSDRIG